MDHESEKNIYTIMYMITMMSIPWMHLSVMRRQVLKLDQHIMTSDPSDPSDLTVTSH